MRTNERWVAGVAGGVAYRFDLDPTLVRCVWVVLSLFAGVGLVLYGLAWALLPEESDGRIHLEEALSGRFNAGLAGAIGMTIIGMSTFGSGFIPNWYVHEAGIAAALWPLFWLGLFILGIVFLIRRAQWVGYDVELASYDPGEELPGAVDLVVGGGGQDSGQERIKADLVERGPQLRAWASDGMPMLVICGLYQLFGHRFITGTGAEIPGIAYVQCHGYSLIRQLDSVPAGIGVDHE